MTIIGLGGYARAGKDTVAEMLERDHGFRRTYMAAPIEQAMLELNPFIPSDPNGHYPGQYERYSALHYRVGYDESKKNPEVRRFLEHLGVEVGREMFGENVWVDYAFQLVDSWASEGYSVAVAGVRFPNELAAVRDRGGVTLWVDRGTEPVSNHSSAVLLGPDDFDGVLDNRGTLDDLRRATTALVGRLSGRSLAT